ncbi:MAG: peptidylprolyl isomerase [Planctomycetota bacterium]
MTGKLLILALAALSSMLVVTGATFAQDESSSGAAKDTSPAYVKMSTTAGDVIIELNREKAPITVKNFIDYVEAEFYNGTIFHRIVPNFVIQGGGFTVDMVKKDTRAGIENEWNNGLKNTRGTLSMARTNDPNSATSQFFVNLVDNAPLDMARPQTGGAAYAVFGEVIYGMDVVDAIAAVKTSNARTADGGQMANVPTEAQIIESAEVITAAQAQEYKDLAIAARKAAQQAQVDKGLEILKKKDVDVEKSVVTDSGLCYIVAADGQGASPTIDDTITFHYTLWLTNGTMLQTSRGDENTPGNPLTYPLKQLIGGWQEVVPQMKIGEKRWLIVPSDLGYGSRARRGIPANSTLVFELELVSIEGT